MEWKHTKGTYHTVIKKIIAAPADTFAVYAKWRGSREDTIWVSFEPVRFFAFMAVCIAAEGEPCALENTWREPMPCVPTLPFGIGDGSPIRHVSEETETSSYYIGTWYRHEDDRRKADWKELAVQEFRRRVKAEQADAYPRLGA